ESDRAKRTWRCRSGAAAERSQQVLRRAEALSGAGQVEADLQLVLTVERIDLRLGLDQLDDAQRIDVRLRPEDDAAAPVAEVELAHAERIRTELDRGHREQLLERIRQQAEAVDHFDLQLAQRVDVARAGDALVQRQARVHVADVA